MLRYFFNPSDESETEQPCNGHDLVYVYGARNQPKMVFVWETEQDDLLFRRAEDCANYYDMSFDMCRG